MTRVLSALVLLPVVLGSIWFLPPFATLILALMAGVLAFSEYRMIAQALGVSVPAGIGGTAVVLCGYAMYIGDRWADGSSSALGLDGLHPGGVLGVGPPVQVPEGAGGVKPPRARPRTTYTPLADPCPTWKD